MTRNGSGRGYVFVSTDTWRSLMASSRALWARGLLRLISSARTMFANRGLGEQVTRELDAAERPGNACRYCPREGGLPGAGDVLEEDVSPREEGSEGEFHLLALPQENRLDVGTEPGEERQAFLGIHTDIIAETIPNLSGIFWNGI